MPLKEFKANLTPKARELSFTSRNIMASSTLMGELVSSMKGQGIEFEDYRDYTPQDDARRIDWRASKRAQRTLVREYRMEINFNVFFLVDTSESMLFASTEKLKCEYTAEVVATLFFGLIQGGNSVGFGLFNDHMYRVVKPALSKIQFYQFIKEIEKPKNYGGPKNLVRTMQQLLAILSAKTLIFVVSDFVGVDQTFAEMLKVGQQKHDLVGLMVRDPRDNEIPPDIGQLILENPSSKDKMYIDSRQYARSYAEYNTKQTKLLKTMFKKIQSDLIELQSDKDPVDPLMEFFKKRGARWR